MPVKIENCTVSVSPFDATMSIFNNSDIFNEDGEPTDLLTAISNSSFPSFVSSDELWDSPEFSYSFIQTPPQSPSLQSEDSLSSNLDDKMLCKNGQQRQEIVSHDCMWAGVCQENFCQDKERMNQRCFDYTPSIRPETPFNLSISPQNSYGFISCDIADNVCAEENSNFYQYYAFQQPQQVPQVNNSNCNEYSHMDNDHSYDISAAVQAAFPAQQLQSRNDQFGRNNLIKKSQQQHSNSLLNKRCTEKTNQTRISKMKYSKKVATQKKKAVNSILNSQKITATNGSKITKIEKDISPSNNILKPTIISVATLKKMPDSFHTKYKVSTKRRQKLNMMESLPTIEEKSTPIVNRTKKQPITTNLSINEIVGSIGHSPACSDSEDNCSSSLSSGDPNDPNKLEQPPVKRREHNDSERKRRDHLRNSFNNLRDQIPKLKQSQKRPPRIMILHEATTYVTNLTEENSELAETLQKEYEKRKRLLELLKKAQEKAMA